MKVITKISIWVCLMLMFVGASAMAADASDENAPVKGDYKMDNQLVAEEREKSELAKQYYIAKTTGNYSAAAQYLTQNNPGRSIANTYAVTRATSKQLSMTQYPQERDNWCGYSAIQSILSEAGISKTQSQIQSAAYPSGGALAWYYSDYSNISDYPARVYIKNQTGYNYVPFPLAAAGSASISTSDLEYKVVFTIDQGYGVLVAGISAASGSSHMPGYPSRSVNHWLAIYGYGSSGSTIYVVDPAKSSAVSWSSGISAKYTVSSTKMAAYASARGIVW